MKELLEEKLAKQFTTVQFEFIEHYDELTV